MAKKKKVPLVDRDGAREAICVAFRAAAKEAKRIASEKYMDREDVAAAALRDLGSLFMLCAEFPADAIEFGCEHIRKGSPAFGGRR